MLGKMEIPLMGKKVVTVFGGPYYKRPKHLTGVKLAREINAPHDVNIPIEDFSVPMAKDMRPGLLKAIQHLDEGRSIYVGCMGGKGRTGLFMAVLAKAFGVENPVEFVRTNYYPHAVETRQQYDYVMNYEIPREVRRLVRWMKIKSVFRLKKHLTNPYT